MMVLMPFAPASVVFALPSAAVHFARLLFFTEIQLHVGAARAAAQFRLRWVVTVPTDRRVLLRKSRARSFFTAPDVMHRAAGAMAPHHILAAPSRRPIVTSHRGALLLITSVQFVLRAATAPTSVVFTPPAARPIVASQRSAILLIAIMHFVLRAARAAARLSRRRVISFQSPRRVSESLGEIPIFANRSLFFY